PEPSSPESLELLRKAASGGARDALSAAVLAGLIRWPDQIFRYAEALARAPDLDPRFFALLECSDATAVLESHTLATILQENGLEVPGPADYSGLRFGFLAPDANAEQAAEEVDTREEEESPARREFNSARRYSPHSSARSSGGTGHRVTSPRSRSVARQMGDGLSSALVKELKGTTGRRIIRGILGTMFKAR
ncbi:MAG: hypothetical protein P8X51_16050, partial [Maritimibacter sp.]